MGSILSKICQRIAECNVHDIEFNDKSLEEKIYLASREFLL